MLEGSVRTKRRRDRRSKVEAGTGLCRPSQSWVDVIVQPDAGEGLFKPESGSIAVLGRSSSIKVCICDSPWS